MKRLFWLLAITFPTLAACKTTCHAPGHHHSVHDTIAQKQGKQALSVRSFPKAPQKVDMRDVVKAQWDQPPREFFVQKRVKHLQRFPCSGCHDNKMHYNNPERFRATHGEIQLKHASPGVLQCQTCHQRQDMDRLKLPAGGSTPINHAYKLCGSCHQKQATDWAGGAHGKRVKHWFGPRILRNCTSCHNPHQPLFPKKWPKIRYRPFHPKQKSHAAH